MVNQLLEEDDRLSTIELPVNCLPSKGYGYNINIVKIPKLIFSQIMDYTSELDKSKNELSTFLTQLKHLVLTLEGGASFSMYDAIPIIAIRSYSSVNDKLSDKIKIKYNCPYHKRPEVMAVDLNKLKFNDIDPLLTKIDSIKINGKFYKFRIPTVKEFIDTVNEFKLLVPVPHAMKVLWILSMFADIGNKDVSKSILNAVMNMSNTEDIVLINKLYELLTGSFTHFVAESIEDKEGGEPVVVRIKTITPITDIFQNIPLNQDFNQASINIRKDD